MRGAKNFPHRIQPQLVSLLTRPPRGDWVYEIKFDGYRMFARIDGGVGLFTKNGYDWTKRMPRLAQDLQSLPVRGTSGVARGLCIRQDRPLDLLRL